MDNQRKLWEEENKKMEQQRKQFTLRIEEEMHHIILDRSDVLSGLHLSKNKFSGFVKKGKNSQKKF